MRMTRIRFETRESRTVHSDREQNAQCRTCVSETRHLPIAEMAVFLAVTEKEVFRLSEKDYVQSAETEDGRLLICLSCATRLTVERGYKQQALYFVEVTK